VADALRAEDGALNAMLARTPIDGSVPAFLHSATGLFRRADLDAVGSLRVGVDQSTATPVLRAVNSDGLPSAPCRHSKCVAMKLEHGGRRSRYRLRKQIVEPVFGQIKQARGSRQFLLRGLNKVRGEWAMICSVHNLLKLAKATG
jgi:Transposase DDE domain